MAKTDNLTDFLTNVADAIRAKKGTSDLINPQNFDSEIASISTSKEEQEKTVTITENGTVEVIPDSGKALSKVTVTANVSANVITKSITANGTYNATDDGVDGYSTVDVNVAGIEDISTSNEMTALLVEANLGKVYRFTGTTDETYTNGDLYEVASISGTYKFKHYALVILQLSTPVNVSASGTTVSWDEVENATSYTVLADGNEIGTVEQQIIGYNVSISNVSQLSSSRPFNVGFGYDNGTNIDYSGFPKYISANSASDIVSLNTGDYANSQGVSPNIIVVGVYSAIIAAVQNVGTTGGVSFVSIGNPADYQSGSGYTEFGYNQMGIYKIEGDGTISFNGWDDD